MTKRRILYIEDQILIGVDNLDGAMAAHPDAEIEWVYNFAEAVKQLKSETPFDLIVSDFEYPGRVKDSDLGGADLYQWLQQTGNKTPLVFLTGTNAKVLTAEMDERGQPVSEHIIFNRFRKTLAQVITAATDMFSPPEPGRTPGGATGPKGSSFTAG